MAAQFTVSPGVSIQEVDNILTVPAVPTNVGALAGVFGWGPAMQPLIIGSQNDLASVFGKPITGYNIETWYTGFNFLAYSSSLYVSRAVDANTYNALALTIGTSSTTQINNSDAYQALTVFPANSLFAARYPGSMGNSLSVSICPTATAFSGNTAAPASSNSTAVFTFAPGASTTTLTVTNVSITNPNTAATSDATLIANSIAVGDLLSIGNTTVGTQVVSVSSIGAPVVTANGVAAVSIGLSNTISLSNTFSTAQVARTWEYARLFSAPPGTSDYVASQGGRGDELHVVIVDSLGKFSGTPGAVLETYFAVSRASDSKSYSGLNNYYASVINTGSGYAWWTGDAAGAPTTTSANSVASTLVAPVSVDFIGGTDSASETTIAAGAVQQAIGLFSDAEKYAVNALMLGPVQNNANPVYAISEVAEARKDCVVFISPTRTSVVGVASSPVPALVSFAQSLPVSTYAFLDTGYKYQYDLYNDQYVYVPLNGDTAGLYAQLSQPWFSPAGLNRGQIKNCVKLAYNPSSQADRDVLYQAAINPVVTLSGQGTVLFGDRVLTTKPSAFSRINVRGLFIVLEKSIATAAKYSLFEQNDSTTQQNFVNMVTPFLRGVQGGRGIASFQVICDATNNTPQVVQNNQFVANIRVVPLYSINYISLTFTAESGSVQFSETTGVA